MIRTFTAEELAQWNRFASLPDLDRARLGPTSRWLSSGSMCHFVAEDGDRLIGRLSAFINPAMQDQEVPTGQIGFMDYPATALETDRAALDELVTAARRWLGSQGMKRLRAPMNFSTWNSYRAVTWTDNSPPFLSENPFDARYGQLLAGHLAPVASYRTALITDIARAQQVAKVAQIDQAEAKYGLKVVWLTRQDAVARIRDIYQLASRIFPCDWSFAPISFEEFSEMFLPLSQQVPEFQCLIAETAEGEWIGLCYGFLNPAPGPKTAVLKTFGVIPEWQSRMVSYLLAYKFHTVLIEQGYTQFLHALMKEDNRSRHMSDHYATKIRGYSLYGGDTL